MPSDWGGNNNFIYNILVEHKNPVKNIEIVEIWLLFHPAIFVMFDRCLLIISSVIVKKKKRLITYHLPYLYLFFVVL